MAVNRGTALARELGAELKRLRNQADLTLRVLEERIGISNAKISLWENGHRLPSLDDLTTTLDALEVAEDERERILGLRRQAEGPGQLIAGVPSIGEQLARLIEQEQVAERITEVNPLLIPGLLQTSDYARAVLGGRPDVDTMVALRVGRRDILTRSRNPVQLVALIDDEALIRPVAPREVMVDQLRHLIRMAELPNITIQAMSSTRAGYTPMLAGPFIMLEFPSATPIVHLEHYRASATLWEEEDVGAFIRAVEEIRNAAMTPERTSEVIVELVQGMETET